jgi:hypothetical protein
MKRLNVQKSSSKSSFFRTLFHVWYRFVISRGRSQRIWVGF